MNQRAIQPSSLQLAALPTAVVCSRMFIRHVLRCWELPDLVDAAELVTSELVTNAVKATGVIKPNPSWTDLEKVPLINVRITAHGDGVSIQIWDVSLERPLQPEAGTDGETEGGRGLFIVRCIARKIGHFYPRSGGKVVWAELALEARVPPLPRRASKPSTIQLPLPDPDLLRKLLAGLQAL
ncbi:ATP-binding protein [Streptomyces sp. SID13666]|uniref:ATP-binding protein n=1 Tax=Streptomyces sp. SID13666 TaxID=2706054 RepID=UPI0013C1E8FD|nr:ATP-binding protein [Streptomyces sp. SID13666]NEA56401.1 ATP-binding protein [Streptomyces sp. SID13666]